MLLKALRRLVYPIAALAVLLVYGTYAFSLFEGIDLFDSLYWTVTVLSTVGFGDITPKSPGGKVVFMSLAFFGLAMYGYIISSITSALTEERFIGVLSEMLVLRRKRAMRGHVVIIDWNSISRYVYRELKANGIEPLVVVNREDLGRELAEDGVKVLVGSYTKEDTLGKASIGEARAVILTQPDPTERLVSLLKIRKLNRGVDVIVVSHEEEMKDVFLQAGATKVTNISDIGGRLVASHVFEPHVAEALADLAEAESGLDMVERRVPEKLDGKSIVDLRRMGFKGAVILVRRGEDRYYYPDERFVVKKGDIIVFAALTADIESASTLFS